MKIYKLVIFVFGLAERTGAIDLLSLSEMTAMTEETRYIGSDGESINLAEAKGHTRLDLTRVNKYSEPKPIENSFIQIEEC